VRGRVQAAIMLLSSMLLMAAGVEGAEIIVLEAQARRVEERMLLDARVEYHLSQDAEEALQSGVPLTFDLHVKVRRKGGWLWERALWEGHFRYQIRYRALSEIYQVVGMDTGWLGNYATRDVALYALGNIRNVPLMKASQAVAGEEYEVLLHITLDREQLPLPLRLLAYLKPTWYLSSEWSRWPLQQ